MYRFDGIIVEFFLGNQGVARVDRAINKLIGVFFSVRIRRKGDIRRSDKDIRYWRILFSSLFFILFIFLSEIFGR